MTKLTYGNTNTYFIRGKCGGLLIDTDYPGTLPAFFREIKRSGISLYDITYIIATHYHPDHIGLVSDLMDLGVKLLLVDVQREYVHFADEILGRDRTLGYKPILEEEAVIISCEKSREFLSGLGIDGEIVSTPSHSGDSISIVLDDGNCIVGDLEPIDYLAAYENNINLQTDWQHIMGYMPKAVYYAHANPRFFDGTAAAALFSAGG